MAHRTVAPCRMLCTAWSSSRRASARSSFGLLAHLLAGAGFGLGPSVLAGLAKQGEGFLHQLAGQLLVLMLIDHQVQSVFAQGGQDPGRMAQTDRLLAVGQQSFEQIVDGQVARAQARTLSPRHTA